VEGGGETLASFARGGFYDRVEVAAAPLLIGGRNAPGPLGGDGWAILAEAPRLARLTARRRGKDVILTALRQGVLEELLARVLPAG
ncbi:MAG TPA: dihydrofolate reductase family protein, partial [Thermoanaerobaculia bacterium]